MPFMQLAGMGLSALSSYMGKKNATDNAEAMNAAKLKQFEVNKSLTAELISTLDNRTDRAESEAVRTSIRRKMNISRAAHKAAGDAAVKAAHLGGAGKRTMLATIQGTSREAGDLITDANINLQTELTNISEHFNDTATKAIANLNNNIPILGTGPNTLDMLTSAAGSAMDYYSQLSDPSKAKIKGLFKPGASLTIPKGAFNPAQLSI